MYERKNLPAGAAYPIQLTGRMQCDLVDADGRRLPFLIEGDPNPKLSIKTNDKERFCTNMYNTVSGAAGDPVDGVIRIYPFHVELEEWAGQIGQTQLVVLTLDGVGAAQFTEANIVLPPGAQGMRIQIPDVVGTAGGNISWHEIQFGTGQHIVLPPCHNGVIQIPLLDSTFTYTLNTILPDGSDHMAQGDTIDVYVSFMMENPVRNFMFSGSIMFSDSDNIAQATTYTFAVPVENLDRYKRIAWSFLYDYEDDANTAGGNVLFNHYDPATQGGIAYVTWAFPLGTDVGADRRGKQVINVADPSAYTIIAIQNSDAAKDIDNWELTGHGCDEY